MLQLNDQETKLALRSNGKCVFLGKQECVTYYTKQWVSSDCVESVVNIARSLQW